jgi:hypothetical protein
MRTFRDNADRQWNVEINVGALKRIKAALGVDLLALDVGDPPLGARLTTDMILVCDILYVLVAPQARLLEPPLTDEAFGEGLGPEGYAEGHTAFQQELIDFFRKAGRPELAKMLAAHAKLVELATEQVAQRLDGKDLEAMARKIVGELCTGSLPLPESRTSTPSPSGRSLGELRKTNEPAGTAMPT